MKNLKLTTAEEVSDPRDGEPYVFHNDEIVKTWIFMGLQWILDDGVWDDDHAWDMDGRWNYWGPPSA